MASPFKNLKAANKKKPFMERFVRHFLRKRSPKTEKRWLKLLGYWSVEDELCEILMEEITKEIDKEILESIKDKDVLRNP